MAQVAYLLLEGQYLYGVMFNEELAHEIASEYNFDIEEVEDAFEYEQGGTIN